MAKQKTNWNKGNETERLRAELHARILEAHNRSKVSSIFNPSAILTPKMSEFQDDWLRDFREWKPLIKTKNQTRMRVNLAHHLFRLYPIPRFMDNIWKVAEGDGANFRRVKTTQDADGPLVDFFLPWYIALGCGKSLHRSCASLYLSRKETHFFTQAPDRLNPNQAIWWARARGLGANLGMANNIALSRVGDRTALPTEQDFWISVVRFFITQDIKSSQMTNLMDYINAMLADNPNYSLKGRTGLAMLESSRQWHQLVRNQKEMSRHKWESTGIPTWQYKTGKLEENTQVTWLMREILTGSELVEEGHRQHHCVASYKTACINRSTSIWTLRRQKNHQESERTITVELNKSGSVVQARGFANRPPKPDERHVLEKWIYDNNFGMTRY